MSTETQLEEQNAITQRPDMENDKTYYMHLTDLGITIGFVKSSLLSTNNRPLLSVALSFVYKGNSLTRKTDQYSRKIGRSIVDSRLGAKKAHKYLLDLEVLDNTIHVRDRVYNAVQAAIDSVVGLVSYRSRNANLMLANDDFFQVIKVSLLGAGDIVVTDLLSE